MPPSAYSRIINSWGLFLMTCGQKLTCLRKARECELATLDEKSTSSGGIAELIVYVCAIEIEGKNRGEEARRDDTCDHAACPEAGKK